MIGDFPSYGAFHDNWTDLPDLSKTFRPYGASGTSARRQIHHVIKSSTNNTVVSRKSTFLQRFHNL